MSHDLFDTRREFTMASGTGTFDSLPVLEVAGVGPISRLPVSIRIALESVLRNRDGEKITVDHIRRLANWQPNASRADEISSVQRTHVRQVRGSPRGSADSGDSASRSDTPRDA